MNTPDCEACPAFPERIAIQERLANISQTALESRAITSATLKRIEDNMQILSNRVIAIERCQSATDPILDVIHERLDIIDDRSENSKSWIDRQEGGKLMRIQLLSALVTIVGLFILIIKAIFWHN